MIRQNVKQKLASTPISQHIEILTASPLIIWFAAFSIQKLLVAQAVDIE